MKMNLFKASIVALTCLAVGACSTTVVNNSKELQAQKQLEAKGVAYNTSNFISSAGAGDMDSVKLFLEGGMDINAYFSSTALSAASSNGKVDVVRYLLQNGANPNIETYYGTALVVAVKNAKNLEIVNLLLAAKANPNATSSDGHSVLSVAAFTGNPEIITALVNAGANVNYMHPVTGATPLSVAAYYGQKDAVLALIKSGANVNYVDNRKMSILDWSQISSFDDISKILIENGASLNPLNTDAVPVAMIAALAHQDTEMVSYLIGKGVSVNGLAFGKMPILTWCAKNGLQQSGIELIKLGADTSSKDKVSGSTALDFAIMLGETDLAKALDPSVNISAVSANAAADPNLRPQKEVIQDYVNNQYYQGSGAAGGGMDYVAAISDTSYKADVPAATTPAPAMPVNPPSVQKFDDTLADQVNSNSIADDLKTDPVFKNDATPNSPLDSSSSGSSFQDFDSQISNDMNSIDTSLNKAPSTATPPPADQK